MHDNVRCASVAAVIVLALSGGASAMFESRDTKLQAVKTVGIISAIGDQLTLAKAGLTGLDNSSVEASRFRSWGLDDLIVQQATAALSGRFQVQAGQLSARRLCEHQGFSDQARRASARRPVQETRSRPKFLRKGSTPTSSSPRHKANLGGGRGRKVEGMGIVTYRHGPGVLQPALCPLRNQNIRRQDVRHDRKNGRPAIGQCVRWSGLPAPAGCLTKIFRSATAIQAKRESAPSRH